MKHLSLSVRLPSPLLAAVLGLLPLTAAQAQITTLASFDSYESGGLSGTFPLGGVTLSGTTLYGTTTQLGPGGQGTVYSLPLSGGTPTTLASFTGANGGYPVGGLTVSGSTIYGTTSYSVISGALQPGTVFSLPLAGGSPATLTGFPGTNQEVLFSGVILSDGTLYGTTHGTFPGPGVTGTISQGTVYSLPADGGSPTTLVTFNGTNNGSAPGFGKLVLSGSTLYGTTSAGGSNGQGTLFSVSLTDNTFAKLATFPDGKGITPAGDMVLSGNTLYGTTSSGTDGVKGTVFAFNLTDNTLTTLATFTGPNGDAPGTGLVLSGDTLYGITSKGGDSDLGTVFSLSLDDNTLTTLDSFEGGTNGSAPAGSLALFNNTLYGATQLGGLNGTGTVFALSLEAVPEPSTWAMMLGGLALLTFGGTRLRRRLR